MVRVREISGKLPPGSGQAVIRNHDLAMRKLVEEMGKCIEQLVWCRDIIPSNAHELFDRSQMMFEDEDET